MKRSLLVISGTVIGGVSVLSLTPGSTGATPLLALASKPQSSASSGQIVLASSNATNPNVAKKHKKVALKHKTKKKTHKVTKHKAASKTKIVKKKRKSTAATIRSTATRTISGSTSQTPFGPVQVQITVKGRKIISARARQIPQGGRSSWINRQAVPYLIQETLAAQSAHIQGVSGATYTSEAWAQSLQSALSKI